ncbi:MAG TPA: hypothetical protein PKC43_13985 [Phycisphaerales bacterium]|nr:hypothetical protein [Phycisphaerales bacterium]HMP38544.1 hypothetical protein [Phycisphaerales bacterium]
MSSTHANLDDGEPIDRPPRVRRRPERSADSKQRLRELVELATVYRGLSIRQTAAKLNRDVHNVVPGSGIPKLDLVQRLAELLEWSVQEVSDDLLGGPERELSDGPPPPAGASWAQLDRAAFDAQNAGRWSDLVRLGKQAMRAATSGEERVRSQMRVAAGWEAQGRYTRALSTVKGALAEPDRSKTVSLVLRLNLAHFHLLLGNVEESIGVARTVIDTIRSGRAGGPPPPGALGFALSVRANALRVRAGGSTESREEDASEAIELFDEAIPLLAAASDDARLPALEVARVVAEGGRLEMRTLLGQESPVRAVEVILGRLDDVVDPGALDPQWLLEAYGWWCIFGANIVLRHVSDEDRAERLLGVLTNKADEIASLIGNWALRERVWTLELRRRELLADRREDGTIPGSEPWVLDIDDVRSLAGTMARFPVFRETGWQVLRKARLVKGGERS